MADSKTKKIKIKPSDVLFLAVIAYFCTIIDSVIYEAIVWTPIIDEMPLGNFWWTVIYRALSCIAWGVSIYVIWRVSKNNGFDMLEAPFDVSKTLWISAVMTAALMATFIIIDKGFGTIASAVLTGGATYLLFLLVSTAMRSVVIALGQKWGELCFSKLPKYMPWGGIVFGVCAFAAHLITSGSLIGALTVMGINIYFGLVYVFNNRKLVYTIPMMFLMLLSM